MVGKFLCKRLWFHFMLRNGTENAVPVPGRDHIDRDAVINGERLFKGFVAVPVNKDEISSGATSAPCTTRLEVEVPLVTKKVMSDPNTFAAYCSASSMGPE